MRRVLILRVLFAAAAFCVAPLPARPQSADEPQFVPGELIVGYKSEQDRAAAMKEINGTREGVRSLRRPGSVEATEAGSTSLKLHFTFPESTTRGLRSGSGGSELAALQDLAKNLRESDSRVQYAHPNWIMNIDPVETDAVPIEQQSFSGAAGVLRNPASPMPNDPLFAIGLQWHYLPPPMGMNAVGAWNLLNPSPVVSAAARKRVVVAVLDTGLLFDHPDIANSGHVLKGYNFVSRDNCASKPIDRTPDASDTGNQCKPDEPGSSWHGTHVAGIIGAAATNNGVGIAGIAWDIAILPVRILGPRGGNTHDIADAIRWAAGLDVAGVPRNETPADIINMSVGKRVPCTPEYVGELIAAISDARKAGAVLVVSAGNGVYLDGQNHACLPAKEKPECKHSAEDYKKYEPASCPGVISVAASDSRGFLAPYSNWGSVTVMAPGGDIHQTKEFKIGGKSQQLVLGVWSTVKDQYGAMQGTSQAAPHVAGALALALIAHPEWRGHPDLIEAKLRSTAVKPPAGGCPDATPCGAGQLDAAALVAAR
jgi:serine protease